MTERYKLELYIIRENELEFALYDKEAETSQGTTKMIEKKLNWQDERIKELEYQLDVIDGLYASDQEDMSHPFRLDYQKVLNR